MSIRSITGDCRDVLKTLPSESVHTVVTSPPYWGLRDYGTAKWEGGDPGCDHGPRKMGNANLGNVREVLDSDRTKCYSCGARRIDSQIGLEPTFDAFVAEMVAVFREVRRVLRSDGTLWLNLGDSYASSGVSGYQRLDELGERLGTGEGKKHSGQLCGRAPTADGLKPKDLCGIPWRVAFALQADGWWLRQDIIWAKPNPMPESVTDRCTKAHEYIFLLSKSARYFYDAEAIKEPGGDDAGPGIGGWAVGDDHTAIGHNQLGTLAHGDRVKRRKVDSTNESQMPGASPHGGIHRAGAPRSALLRNKRSVWEVATAPFSETHFATFPPKLIEPCIKAGCPDKCCPHCGKGWERVTSFEYQKHRPSGGKTSRIERGNKVHDGGFGGWGSFGTNLRKEVTTLGFQPTCECPAHQPVPGTVLDPFGGAGTTGLVADRLQRNAILIELNPTYARMAEKRISSDAPLFARVAAE